MDASFLLTADPKALAQYLRDNLARLGSEKVTQDLLTKIDIELLPPRIFSSWLSAGGDCEAIREGLGFQNSQCVRRASIAHFGRLFRTVRVNDIWNAIGGTVGIVDYLAVASVCDLKSFCSQIRRSATAEVSTPSRVALVDELYRALRDAAVSDAGCTKPDQRPLSSLHNLIFPACSQEFILSTVDGKSGIDDVGSGEPAFFARTAVFRSRCISDLQDQSVEMDARKVRALMKIGSNDSSSLHDASVTANTQFALEVLEALSSRKRLTGDASVIVSEVAIPLFRKLTRRKCLPETMVRATLAYVAFAQQHISNRMPFEEMLNGPGTYLIKTWGRYPHRLETSLTIYLRLTPNSHLPSASGWLKMVRLVPSALRIRLLSMVSRCDLATDRGLEQSKLQWDSHLLLALPQAEARRILEHLIRSGDENLKTHYPADRRQAEVSLLKIKLSKHEPDVLEIATAAVDDQKKEASRAREQPQRATCISTALQMAAASHCLELYRQTLLWTRKYIKDPLTAMEIFRGPSFTSEEYLDLLCGCPETRDECASLTQDQAASDVRQANVIITECFQTACQAQQEPGFKSYHWNDVLGLMSIVVSCRYKRVKVLQDALELSDDGIFDTVWQDTLDTCMALEKSGLDDDNMHLGFNTFGGPLINGKWVLPALLDPHPATLRFLDTLARSRNAFWEEYRQKHRPATMALVEPYPQGLPLDSLVPVDLRQCKGGLHMPYLLSRAERIVFAPERIALAPQPDADDDVSAIGACVEDWESALLKYVHLSDNRQEAALAAWKHVTGPLSATRMSDLETHLFWSRVFSNSLGDTHLDGPWKTQPAQPPPPHIPAVAEKDQPSEWSPETGVRDFEVPTRRRLEPTRIDAMLNAFRSTNETMSSENLANAYSEVPSHTLDSFWSRWQRPRAATPAVREALVAAAMLHISEANGLSPGVLSQPFPSGNNARFPALYLDGDFLEREDLKRNQHHVWTAMKQLRTVIPATLLLRLTKSLISKDQIPTHAFELLRVLIRGDRPQVALDIVQEIVLDRPDDSSWQRLILTQSLLNSLPKRIAERFLRGLSDAMRKRLSESNASGDSTSASHAPRIKITTVKLLSQLLSGAAFVDESFASSVLIGILASTSHIDVRVSVIESLVDILAKSSDSTLCNEIIAAFEVHLIPVMSGMNERVPMSREEWMACDSDSLPELYGLGWGNLPPVLSCMLSSVGKVKEDMRKQIFDRILIPTLLISCETNGRWIRLFMEGHGMSLPTETLPSPPVQLQFLVELLRWPAYIPSIVVDLWMQVLTIVLDPPPGIVAMNGIVSGDPSILNSSNGQHWLALWGTTAQKILLGRTKPASMLSQEWNSFRQDGLKIHHIQRAVLQQFNLMLPLCGIISDNNFWKSFMDDMRPFAWTSQKLGSWHQNVKPLLQQLKNHVEALRTPEWQRNSDRSPTDLPDTFEWRLWLLTPALESEETRDDDLHVFAASVSELLSELGQSQRLYIRQYDAIVGFIRANATTTDWAKLALIFGSIDGLDFEKLDTMHDMKIDLARQLLEMRQDTPPPEEKLQRRVRAMVHSLANCMDQDMRRVGSKLLQDVVYRYDTRKFGKAWYAEDTTDNRDLLIL